MSFSLKKEFHFQIYFLYQKRLKRHLENLNIFLLLRHEKISLYFFTKGAIHPGVIECSPPKVIGKSFLSKISLLILDILESAFLISLSILKGFKVLMPIFLYGSQFNSSSYSST